METSEILLVEDAKAVQLIVREALREQGNLTISENLKQAQESLLKTQFSMLILDVDLPDGSGFDFCEQVRNEPKYAYLPIVFLTGRTHTAQKVQGFELGANDYVTKPFDPLEFAARVGAHLRRSQLVQTSLRALNFRVDLQAQKVFITVDGQEEELGLTPIEFKLLVHFLKNPDAVFAREELLVSLWGSTVHVSAHTVDTHISSLRKKMGPSGRFLTAVVKKGYRLSTVPPK